MSQKFSTISFLSDYGLVDGFPGAVQSVIRSLVPEIKIIDLTHNISSHNVNSGSLALARAASYMAPGVVIAVVGALGERPAVAVEVGGGQSYLIGPDNGLLAPTVALVGGATDAITLDKSEFFLTSNGAISLGRDICAPIAAQLCLGTPLKKLGTPIDPAKILPGVLPVSDIDDDGVLNAEVLWVDNYGNAQLNVDPDQITGWSTNITLQIDGNTRTALTVESYRELSSTAIGLMTDSYGLVSIVMNEQSASDELAIAETSRIKLSQNVSNVDVIASSQSVTLTSKPLKNGE